MRLPPIPIRHCFAKRGFLFEKKISKLCCCLDDVITKSLTHKEECSNVYTFLRRLRMRSDPV